MRIEVSCFTQRGQELGDKLQQLLGAVDVCITVSRCGNNGESVAKWAKRAFATADILIFIGATGIAVRAIAPLVDSKTSDPGVIVLDEYGRNVIPLLAGHIGRANEQAHIIADVLNARAIITTATDLNDVFAVDVWASNHGYHIQNPSHIKNVSAKLLAGEPVLLTSEFEVRGNTPEGIELARPQQSPDNKAEGMTEADIGITVYKKDIETNTLWLSPPALVLGVGCRKGVSQHILEDSLSELFLREGLSSGAVQQVASIDIKEDEPGLLAFCKQHAWSLQTYSSEELAKVPGLFDASRFVEKTTGVDNVCERSAVLASGGTLMVKKTADNGVTMAVAIKDWTVDFGDYA